MKAPYRHSIILLFAICSGAALHAEGGNPLWQPSVPIPLEEPPSRLIKEEESTGETPANQTSPVEQSPPLDHQLRGELSQSGQQILEARDEYRKALAENPTDASLREHYAWFLYSNGFYDKECLRLLEQSLSQGNAADPAGLFNAIVEVRDRLGLPFTPLKQPAGVRKVATGKKSLSYDRKQVVSGASAKRVEKAELEQVESFKRWIFTPYYDYSFFNHGRQGWQEEFAQILYRVNRRLIIGAEIDILQRPPSGTNIYYSALASYYLTKYLEVHGKISICPDPTFAATQIYTGGFIYQAAPRLGLLFDYQRYNFIQGPIDQINPGLVYNFTDETWISARYVRGWAFYDLQYNYYSTAFNWGLPGHRRLTLAFAYGTDPDAQIGANGNSVTSLSPAYTYSVFFTQPLTRDLNLFTGVQYVYRLKSYGGSELYQQLTPTIGCSMKF
jgi:hypothetical protein